MSQVKFTQCKNKEEAFTFATAEQGAVRDYMKANCDKNGYSDPRISHNEGQQKFVLYSQSWAAKPGTMGNPKVEFYQAG